MKPLRRTWGLIVGALVMTLVSGSGMGAQAVDLVVRSTAARGAQPLLELARVASAVVPPELVRMVEGGQALSNGSDGRLTMLLLGSDTRGGGVQRTDTIMVISIKGSSISAVSIPRDMARIPNPSGGTFSARVNGILKQLKNGRTTAQALAEFEKVIEHLLQIEIDYHALVTFVGFESLVYEIEPVSVGIKRDIKDSGYWDDPNYQSGVYFPAQSGYELHAFQPSGDILCNGLWRNQGANIPSQYWCHRAMPFVRSRKGPGNSDFARARRQQDFVIAAIRRVIGRGSGKLNSLVNAANRQSNAGALHTNIPINLANAMDLFDRLRNSSASFQQVFSPPNFASHIPGGTGYELDLPAVRQVMRQHFGGSGTAPPPAPTATPTLRPTSTPTVRPTSTPTVRPTATATAPGTNPTPSPAPTLAPGATATPSAAPTLAPSATPTPVPSATPTLAPGETPGPTPVGATPDPSATLDPTSTLIPSAAPAGSGDPTLPGATATPPAVGQVPSGAPPPTLAPGETATPAPVGAIAPTPAPGQPSGEGGPVATQEDGLLIGAALAAALLAAGAAFLGWRRLRPSG